ncbi:MAG: hypothetical protein N3A53_03510 [Verrucomicrobiae bacterium]|nr:hypothetical protein [Verrucomicrobiae bacterium]
MFWSAAMGIHGAAQVTDPARVSDPFAWGFEFATALRTDEHDRGLTQANTLIAAAQRGQLDWVTQRVEQVTGWRRGLVYVELGRQFLARGQKEEARRWLQLAEGLGRQIQDWTGPRLLATVSAALVGMGEHEEGLRVAGLTESPQERTALLPAGVVSLLDRGEVEKAWEAIELAGEAHPMEIRMAQARAYLAMARHPTVRADAERCRKAVERAVETAKKLPFDIYLEVVTEGAGVLKDAGLSEVARGLVSEVEALISRSDIAADARAPYVVRVAEVWQGLGEPGRARQLLDTGLQGMELTQDIDQPMVYAVLIGGYVRVGDEAEARARFRRGLELAGELINSRPRVLAVVELCRQMGLSGLSLRDEEQQLLRQLYERLGPPW